MTTETNTYNHTSNLPVPITESDRRACINYIRKAPLPPNLGEYTSVAFRFGTIIYRCRATEEAVENLAARIKNNKFTHGYFADNIFNSPATAFAEFVLQNEISNALQYAEIANLPVYFAKCSTQPEVILHAKQVSNRPEFIVGRHWDTPENKLAPWAITHIATGMRAGSSPTIRTAKQAIQEFNKIPTDTLAEGLRRYEGSFQYQEEALQFYAAHFPSHST